MFKMNINLNTALFLILFFSRTRSLCAIQHDVKLARWLEIAARFLSMTTDPGSAIFPLRQILCNIWHSLSRHLPFDLWFSLLNLGRKAMDDWVSACRNVVVAGARCAGREGHEDLGRLWKARWHEIAWVSSLTEWTIFKDMWRDFTSGKSLTLAI